MSEAEKVDIGLDFSNGIIIPLFFNILNPNKKV